MSIEAYQRASLAGIEQRLMVVERGLEALGERVELLGRMTAVLQQHAHHHLDEPTPQDAPNHDSVLSALQRIEALLTTVATSAAANHKGIQ